MRKGEPSGELIGYQGESKMREKVDRELVLAAFTGLLVEDDAQAVDALAQKYSMNDSEQRRAAKTAIQDVMGMIDASRWGKGEARRRIDEIARRFKVSKDELESLAWEVVRGSMDDPEGGSEYAQRGMHVFREFLRHSIPKGAAFGYTGAMDAYEPKEGGDYPGYKGGVVSDLVRGEFGGGKANWDTLFPEVKQLYSDAGIEEPKK